MVTYSLFDAVVMGLLYSVLFPDLESMLFLKGITF
jgi:hypothetical protein